MSTDRTLPVMLATALITVPATAVCTWWLATRDRPAPPTTGPSAADEPAGRAVPSSPPATDGSEQAAAAPGANPLAREVAAPGLVRRDLPWAAGATRVAATDLDGDGHDEVALAGADGLRFHRADGEALGSVPAAGAVNVLTAFGRAVYAGWGVGREAPTASASVVAYTLDGGRLVSNLVATPQTERPQVLAVGEAGPDLLLAWFTSKYEVAGWRASRAGSEWRLEPAGRSRTAPVWLAPDLDGDGRADLVVGRTYGDAVGSPGDARLYLGSSGGLPGDGAPGAAAGAGLAVAIDGGVRTGCVADTDGDGRPEVVLADGWDKDYGHKAHAQLRIVRWVDGAPRSEVLDRVPGDYDVSRLLAVDLDGDGRQEVVAVTNTRVRVVQRAADGWIAWDLARGAVDAAAVEDGGTALLLLGPHPERVAIKR